MDKVRKRYLPRGTHNIQPSGSFSEAQKRVMGKQVEQWRRLNPLKGFLTKRGLSCLDFSRRIGVARSVVESWVDGDRLPELHYLYEMEKVTGGAISIEAWIVHPRCVYFIDTMRRKRGEG